MNTGIIVLSIISFCIGYFLPWLMVERRKYNKKVREFAERAAAKRKMSTVPSGLTISVPGIGFAVWAEHNDEPLVRYYGNMNLITEILASELRKNKTLRDMIKSAFVKANKSIQ